ncbi:polysaccharide pyruvyl transferase family protein [Kocuria rhizophila]|uniref:polysaccharide pyruvyl transferase family protein n=1 Tax=Kocuria rhizophila TaxID=72000 RepID=UPI003D6F7F9C
MTRVGLVGYFGWGNYGDELMLDTWRRAFRGRAETSVVHTLLHRPYFMEAADDVASRFDALVIGGGDLLHPDAISSLYWNRAWLTRPVVIAGVGAALERTARRADVVGRLQAFLNHDSVKLIGVRDPGTRDWLEGTVQSAREVTVGADLAFAAPLPQVRARKNAVGIVLRKTPTAQDVDMVRRLTRMCSMEGRRVEILVLAIGQQRDLELDALQRTLATSIPIVTASSVAELTARLGEYGALATAKFHGAVMASRLGIPAVSLRTTHKVEALAQMLGDDVLSRSPQEMSDRQLQDALTRAVSENSVRILEATARKHITSAVSAALQCIEGAKS